MRLRDRGGPPRCRLGSGKQGTGRTGQEGGECLSTKRANGKGAGGRVPQRPLEMSWGQVWGQWPEGTLRQQLQEAVGVPCPWWTEVCAPPAPPARAGAEALAVPCGCHSSASQPGAGGLFRGARTWRHVGHLPRKLLPTRSPVEEAGAGTGHLVRAGAMPGEPGGWPADDSPTCCWNPGLCVTFPPSHCSGQFRLFKVHVQPWPVLLMG